MQFDFCAHLFFRSAHNHIKGKPQGAETASQPKTAATSTNTHGANTTSEPKKVATPTNTKAGRVLGSMRNPNSPNSLVLKHGLSKEKILNFQLHCFGWNEYAAWMPGLPILVSNFFWPQTLTAENQRSTKRWAPAATKQLVKGSVKGGRHSLRFASPRRQPSSLAPNGTSYLRPRKQIIYI